MPAVGLSAVANNLSNVVLPAPEGPITATRSPSAIRKFTRVIARHFPEEERIELVEMLCEVIYADGVLHEYEASLFRRASELIHVSDKDERGCGWQRTE